MATSSPSTSRGGTPTSVLGEVEQTLLTLEEYKLPPEFTLNTDELNAKKAKVPALIARYEQLREGMLKSNVEREVLDHVMNHDITESPTDVSEEELAEIENQRKEMTKSFESLADQMLAQERELHSNYELLQERKEQLRNMLDDFKQKMDEDDEEWTLKDLEQSMLTANEDDGISDEDLAKQEEELNELQREKMELEAELDKLQSETDLLKQQNPAWVQTLPEDDDINALEKENEELERQLSKIAGIKEDYTNRRILLEELSGVEIVSVEEEDGQQASQLLHVNIQLLREFPLRVTLTRNAEGNDVIQSASFVEPTEGAQYKDPNHVYFPPLDDLISKAQTFNTQVRLPGLAKGRGGFRFLVHSAMARLEIRNDRMAELELLRKNFGCQVHVHQNPNDPEDHLFQKVTCQMLWKEQNVNVTAHLRMTPDCPRVEGSVFLESLQCEKHQWAIQMLSSQLQGEQSRFSSPIQLVRELQQSLVMALHQKPSVDTAMANKQGDGSKKKKDSPLNHDVDKGHFEC